MEELNKAVELTAKNLGGMSAFCIELKEKVETAETDNQKRHLVSFCQALNDVVKAVLEFNNNLSGKKDDV